MEDGEVRASIPRSSAEDDPELARPLESIADFERRQAEPAVRGERGDGAATDSTAAAVTEGGTPPEVDGTPVPALADRDAVEPIGDAPIGDSANSEGRSVGQRCVRTWRPRGSTQQY